MSSSEASSYEVFASVAMREITEENALKIDTNLVVQLVQSVVEGISILRNPACLDGRSPWVQVHVFGSCALGAATAFSDIDLYGE